MLDLGVKSGVVENSGAWFSYDSQRLGQGRENSRQFLKDNPEIALQIEQGVRESAGLLSVELIAGGDEDAADSDD